MRIASDALSLGALLTGLLLLSTWSCGSDSNTTGTGAAGGSAGGGGGQGPDAGLDGATDGDAPPPTDPTAYYLTEEGAGDNAGQDGPWSSLPTSPDQAMSAAQFNQASNWSPADGEGAIDPGDTVYVIGPVGTALTFAGSGTPGNLITLDGWEGGSCEPTREECTEAARMSARINLPGIDYVVVRDLRFADLPRAIAFENATLSTGVEIRHNTFGVGEWASVYMPLVNDCVVHGNRFDAATPQSGQNIQILGGKRNRITDNDISGGKTCIIFKPSRNANGGGLASVVDSNIVTGNTCSAYREEGISFDVIGDDGDQIPVLDYDTVAAVSEPTITLSHPDWELPGIPSYVGYDVIFMDGGLAGQIRTITGHTGAELTVAGSLAGVSPGDTVLLGAPFKHNYVANNTCLEPHASSILLFGMGVRNIIENNHVPNGHISLRSLRDLAQNTTGVTGTCSIAPNMYNLVRNNVVGESVNVWLRDIDNQCESGWPHYHSYGNTVLDNTIGNRLYVHYQYYYAAGNSGTEVVDNATASTAYAYDWPFIESVPTIGADGAAVQLTFSEAVELSGYTDGDLSLRCDAARLALTAPSGSGTAWSFVAASTVAAGASCTLDFNGAAGSIQDAAGNDMTVVGNKPVTNGSQQ